MKFYVCAHCGNIITFLENKGVPVVCCGEKMRELIPGTTDAAQEKHVPVVDVQGAEVTVRIGSVEHPMEDKHYIQWVVLETSHGFQKQELAPGQKPEAKFALAQGEAVQAAYAYCNLHSLWQA